MHSVRTSVMQGEENPKVRSNRSDPSSGGTLVAVSCLVTGNRGRPTCERGPLAPVRDGVGIGGYCGAGRVAGSRPTFEAGDQKLRATDDLRDELATVDAGPRGEAVEARGPVQVVGEVVAVGVEQDESAWRLVRRPSAVTWLIASAPWALTALTAAVRPGTAESIQLLMWLLGIGVSAEAASEPNIMTVPQPPSALAAW